MKAGGSGPKGGAFERLVCKRLSLYVTKGRRDDVFWRTAMSGGRATVQWQRHGIVNKSQIGDITAIAPEGQSWIERFLFECKHRDDLKFASLITSCSGLLADWWLDAEKKAQRAGKQPVVIARQNRYPIILLCPMGCTAFNGEPWATLYLLKADIHLFETAMLYDRPTIRRPHEPIRTAAD
jgi:hypothetical protein